MQLNWNLDKQEQRLEAIQDMDLTQCSTAQLERIADYLLWPSPDADTMGLVKWNWSNANTKTMSLEAIQEQGIEPSALSNNQTKKGGRLERSDVLRKLGEEHPMLNQWLNLWRQIDELEFQVQVWELNNGKRRPDLPIRNELFLRLYGDMIEQDETQSVEKATNSGRPLIHEANDAINSAIGVQLKQAGQALKEEGIASIPQSYGDYLSRLINEALHWEGYKALKKKRQLVALRTEQYTLLDCIQGENIRKHNFMPYTEESRGTELIGFKPFMALPLLISYVDDTHFKSSFNSQCIEQLKWADDSTKQPSGRILDLRDMKTLKSVLINYYDIEDLAFSGNYENREIFFALYSYLNYYIKNAELSEEMKDILYLKMSHKRNKEIAEFMLKKYGLIYGENYISTIVNNRILKPIMNEIEKHYKMIEFILVGPSVFKRCGRCGHYYPRNSEYFLKRKSCSDGFYNICKKCNKENKDAKKNKR